MQNEIARHRSGEKTNGNGPRQISEIIPGAMTARQAGEPEETARTVRRATLAELEISHPKLRTAVAQARAWAQRKRDGYDDASLVLVGPNGTGKTHIARAILWSIVYAVDGKPVAPIGQFFLGRDIMELLNSGNRPGDLIPTGLRYGGEARRCPMVVIDDVGSEGNLSYVGAGNQKMEIQARYFQVINHCYENKISLIITGSNNCGTLEGMADHLGPRSWDRLLQMAPSGFMLEMTGVPSWRIKFGGRRS